MLRFQLRNSVACVTNGRCQWMICCKSFQSFQFRFVSSVGLRWIAKAKKGSFPCSPCTENGGWIALVHAVRCSSSSAVSSSYNLEGATIEREIKEMYDLSDRRDVSGAVEKLEKCLRYSAAAHESKNALNGSTTAAVSYSFEGILGSAPWLARDVAVMAMKLYTRVGQMDKIRQVFVAAVRDFSNPNLSPFSLVNVHLFNAYLEVLTLRKQYDVKEVSFVLAEMKKRDVEPNGLTYHFLTEIHIRAGYDPKGLWEEMMQKKVPIFRPNFASFSGVSTFGVSLSSFASSFMSTAAVQRSCVSAATIATETSFRRIGDGIVPLPATLQTLLTRVVPFAEKSATMSSPSPSKEMESNSTTDQGGTVPTAARRRGVLPSASLAPQFVLEVTRASLQFGGATPGTSPLSSGPHSSTTTRSSTSSASTAPSHILDKKQMVELIEQWLSFSAISGQSNSAAKNSPNASPKAALPIAPTSSCYPPEYILWLLLELEVRCVLDKANFVQFVQKRHIVALLLHCAKCADANTLSQVLALMDRHLIRKTADTGALAVWCYAQALQVEAAIDMILWMSDKGYLEHQSTTPFFQRYTTVDTLRYTMDRHFLMCFVDSLSTPELVERALSYLQRRQYRDDDTQPTPTAASLQDGNAALSTRRMPQVSSHILDLLVLAYGKIGKEREAMKLVHSYDSVWHVTPRTNTLNALLMGLQLALTRRRASGGAAGGGGGASLHHRDVFLGLTQRYHIPIVPNALTYKLLIRQAVLCDNVDEAVEYLQMVSNTANQTTAVRVEVEMILPILERAARAGDAETVNLLSQFALDCDIGIDGAVLQTVIGHLTHAGQPVDVLKGHRPLHEALRSRSKVGRQKARGNIRL